MTLGRANASPPPIPPSAALLVALGGMLHDQDDWIDDLDALAAEAGLIDIEVWPIIHAGVRAGFLLVDEDDAVTLTPKGWAWCEWRAYR